ncbi:glycine cleavage system H protein [Saprolegnia parasitica CBS 223.65]|uniref:Glycine cleavage system H protein n=1 Tax=Saprolegnia parasitica (strain CBS 223.65) TaxID=695850 RepID=A0A067D7Q6_SAPPC|nr:glycine cleavage system H protein [Saprolegnia parasitica CBS 223.65]KDO35042.1 glycine cleavage system H protein [Saprolegnia parasitica CBS 223.65]|eukprot:XP_012194695.1 glycine cleavage system H protein [Saprolegnia parasitica CBS 223.65]
MLSRVFRSAVRSPALARRSFATKFTPEHEYLIINGNEATTALGDIVYVDLPSVGQKFAKGESFGSVESVKAASDVYAPASGEVIEVNEVLASSPELVNESPLENGWFMKIKLTNPAETSELLDEAAYQKHCDEADH